MKYTLPLALLAAATPALAQEQRPATGAASAASGARPQVTAGGPTASESAADIAARMFASGGSLLDAQLQTRAQGNAAAQRGIDPDVSFFAQPAPKPTVIRKHDLITVIVREESSSRSIGSADLEKKYDLDAELREYLGLDLSELRLGTRRGDQRISGEAERGFTGDGSTDRRDSFVTRMTAEVLDVKPNGTLVLQARKRIGTDEDKQTMYLTGICRTADVTAANTVLSTQLHDLRLEKKTTGPVRQATRRGWIPRLIDIVNPF